MWRHVNKAVDKGLTNKWKSQQKKHYVPIMKFIFNTTWFLFFFFIPMFPRFCVTTGQMGRALTLCEWQSQKKRPYVHSDYCYRLRCKGKWGANSMTLVIKGQEITANSLSGRRRVHGPAPKIFTAPHVRNSCRDPIVTTTTFAKVSYVHEKMQEKRKEKRNMGDSVR